MKAYELKDFQISGPSWMESERYEVAARTPTGADGPTVAAMLRSLLAERFGFVAHREKRKGAILALVVAKGGPKFKATVEGAPVTAAPKLVRGSDGMPAIAPGSDVTRTYEIVIGGSDGIVYKIWWRGDTVGRFADYLSSRLNREVIDLTKLAGRYDFQLAWAIEGAGGEIPRIGPPPDQIESHNTPILGEIGQSLFSAIPAQLGLRLEQRRGVTEVLVVDRVEMNPTGN